VPSVDVNAEYTTNNEIPAVTGYALASPDTIEAYEAPVPAAGDYGTSDENNNLYSADYSTITFTNLAPDQVYGVLPPPMADPGSVYEYQDLLAPLAPTNRLLSNPRGTRGSISSAPEGYLDVSAEPEEEEKQ
jgi:hypothetical protein